MRGALRCSGEAAFQAEFGACLLALCLWPISLAAADPRIAVVTSSSVEAYGQALEGIRHALGEGLTVVDLDHRDRLESHRPRVVIAVGSNAAAAAALAPAPVIRSMVLAPGAANAGQNVVSVVSLEVPVEALLAELRRTFPGRTRLGILRNPAKGWPPAAEFEARAREQGFTVRVADCDRPEELLKSFLTLKDQADFVWCLPDSTLYNGATVKPLVMASIQNGVAVIGFSEAFVRAGAAFGIYADFHDIGRQTGELARRLLGGQRPPQRVTPRKFHLAVNERVVRLLGLKYTHRQEPDFQVLR